MAETAPITENPTTDEKSAPPVEASRADPAERRRSQRRKSSKKGRILVLLLVFLVLFIYGTRTFLTVAGHIHPALLGFTQPHLTANILNILFTAVGLLALLFLYRGNMCVRYLFGTAATINIILYAALLSFGLLENHGVIWVAYNAFVVAVSTYVAWACILSHKAIQFLNSQADRR